MTKLREVKINGKSLELPEDLTLMQACENAGNEIPHFCYHTKLSIAGNCRMCLIEVKGSPKPVASCSQNLRDLRPGPNGEPPELFTNSEIVKKARKGVMEFLLINHPLDCPICDQAGECDLQDQAVAFGNDSSRYKEEKRAVKDKYMGPLIKTYMTRCIQCTRCVRFATEIAGVNDLGLVNRGEKAEITTYLEKAVDSELSGNLIDVCPVGALTSAPYSYVARPWELNHTATIDIMDGVCTPINMDVRGLDLLRITPLESEINDGWLSNKGRFIIDSLRSNRIDNFYVKNKKLTESNLDEVVKILHDKIKQIKPEEIASLSSELTPIEAMFACKELLNKLGSYNHDCRLGLEFAGSSEKKWDDKYYKINISMSDIERSDFILLIGTNPRDEASLLNARIRKAWLANTEMEVALVGKKVDLNYDYTHISDNVKDIESLDKQLKSVFENAKNPLIIVGGDVFSLQNSLDIVAKLENLAKFAKNCDENWQVLNFLASNASILGGVAIDFIPSEKSLGHNEIISAFNKGKIKLLFNFGYDFVPSNKADGIVCYFGHHGTEAAKHADIVIPVPTYAEMKATYCNIFGELQQTSKAIFPPELAIEEWQFFYILSKKLGIDPSFDDVYSLRKKIFDYKNTNIINPLDGYKPKKIVGGEFNYSINYYHNNVIVSSSKIMQEAKSNTIKLSESV